MSKFILIFFLLFNFSSTWSFTILIDPGHGGEDDGATGLYKVGKRKLPIKEKDLALGIALRIKKKLSKNYNTFLTRSVDRSLTLAKRAEIAEKVNADLFISVHINSSTKRSSNGFETYYLDNHDDAAVKKVESIENKDLEGEAYIIDKILTDLVIDRTVKSSKGLATSIHKTIRKRVKGKFRMVDRGVKPGLFYVLALTKRPAILLEAGFLSNYREVSKIRTRKFQETYAQAVADGIHLYLKDKIKKKPSLF
tara:strand:+ start:53793 stop:54548 length:756 start_codon:yes stop_codon:yes gene_type:complete